MDYNRFTLTLVILSAFCMTCEIIQFNAGDNNIMSITAFSFLLAAAAHMQYLRIKSNGKEG